MRMQRHSFLYYHSPVVEALFNVPLHGLAKQMLKTTPKAIVLTLHHGGHVGAHLQKNFNELLLLCVPTWPSWPLLFESHRTEGHVSENHL